MPLIIAVYIFICVLTLPLSMAMAETIGNSKAKTLAAKNSAENYSDMALIPKGNFYMGSSFQETTQYYNSCKKLDKACKLWWFRDERPRHTVYLKEYWIDRYETTNADYMGFVLATGARSALDNSCETKGCKDGNLWDGISFPKAISKQPVIQVSWHDAEAYCRWRGKRLPTEAEWEKAARGPSGKLYPWGNELVSSDHAVYKKKWQGVRTLSPVGTHPKGDSTYGIHDMTGNVWEWVSDWYQLDYYRNSPLRNPQGSLDGKYKIVRGGSWINNPDTLHSAFRRWSFPEVRFNDTGFRCAKDSQYETGTD
jgi:formylglycine-generating enzyme